MILEKNVLSFFWLAEVELWRLKSSSWAAFGCVGKHGPLILQSSFMTRTGLSKAKEGDLVIDPKLCIHDSLEMS